MYKSKYFRFYTGFLANLGIKSMQRHIGHPGANKYHGLGLKESKDWVENYLGQKATKSDTK